MHLEHLVVQEGKEGLKNKTKQNKNHADEDILKRHRSQPKELPMAKAGTIWGTKQSSSEL